MLNQGQCSITRSNVAANDLYLGIVFLRPAHAIEYALTVSVGSIDHDHIDPSLDQQLDALIVISTNAHRSTDAQFTFAVFARIGVLSCFQNVFYCNEAA